MHLARHARGPCYALFLAREERGPELARKMQNTGMVEPRN